MSIFTENKSKHTSKYKNSKYLEMDIYSIYYLLTDEYNISLVKNIIIYKEVKKNYLNKFYTDSTKNYTLLHISVINNNYIACNALINIYSTIFDSFYTEDSLKLNILTEFINAKNIDGFTCLHLAANIGNIDILKLLIDNKANLDELSNSKLSALHTAAQGDQLLCFMYIIIIKYNLEYNKIIKNNKNVRLNYDTLKELYQNILNPRDCKGSTPFHWTCYLGNEIIFKFLISRIDNINLIDNNGINALILSVLSDKSSIVIKLLKLGVNKKLKDDKGRTALDIACLNNKIEAISILTQSENKGIFSLKHSFSKINKSSYNIYIFFVLAFILNFINVIILSPYINLSNNYNVINNSTYNNVNNEAINFIGNTDKNYTNIINKISNLKDTSSIKINLDNLNLLSYKNLLIILSILTFIIWCIIILIYVLLLNIDPSSISFNGKYSSSFNQIESLEIINKDIFVFNELRSYYYLNNKNNNSLNNFIKNNYCFFCNIDTSNYIKCKHCNICNFCIINYDHHCFWINKCIGNNNKTLFVLYLIFLLIYLSLYVTMSIMSYIYLSKNTNTFKKNNNSIFNITRNLKLKFVLIIIGIILSLILFICVLCIFIDNISRLININKDISNEIYKNKNVIIQKNRINKYNTLTYKLNYNNYDSIKAPTYISDNLCTNLKIQSKSYSLNSKLFNKNNNNYYFKNIDDDATPLITN